MSAASSTGCAAGPRRARARGRGRPAGRTPRGLDGRRTADDHGRRRRRSHSPTCRPRSRSPRIGSPSRPHQRRPPRLGADLPASGSMRRRGARARGRGRRAWAAGRRRARDGPRVDGDARDGAGRRVRRRAAPRRRDARRGTAPARPAGAPVAAVESRADGAAREASGRDASRAAADPDPHRGRPRVIPVGAARGARDGRRPRRRRRGGDRRRGGQPGRRALQPGRRPDGPDDARQATGSRRPAGSWTPRPTSRCSCSRWPAATTRSSRRSGPGARGYVLKGAQRAELLRAIRAVAAGDAIFGPGVARRLRPTSRSPTPSGRGGVPRAHRTGARDPRAGRARAIERRDHGQLVLSPKTVRNHVSNIFAKLRVRDRAEAIVRAREAGLGGRTPAAG